MALSLLGLGILFKPSLRLGVFFYRALCVGDFASFLGFRGPVIVVLIIGYYRIGFVSRVLDIELVFLCLFWFCFDRVRFGILSSEKAIFSRLGF